MLMQNIFILQGIYSSFNDRLIHPIQLRYNTVLFLYDVEGKCKLKRYQRRKIKRQKLSFCMTKTLSCEYLIF